MSWVPLKKSQSKLANWQLLRGHSLVDLQSYTANSGSNSAFGDTGANAEAFHLLQWGYSRFTAMSLRAIRESHMHAHYFQCSSFSLEQCGLVNQALAWDLADFGSSLGSAEWLWASHFISLSLSFPICKTWIVILTFFETCWSKELNKS